MREEHELPKLLATCDRLGLDELVQKHLLTPSFASVAGCNFRPSSTSDSGSGSSQSLFQLGLAAKHDYGCGASAARKKCAGPRDNLAIVGGLVLGEQNRVVPWSMADPGSRSRAYSSVGGGQSSCVTAMNGSDTGA
jgi:hypothetical protein